MKRAALCLIAAILAGCTGTGRLLSYGTNLASARPQFGGRTLSVYVHPHEDVFLVQASLRQVGEAESWGADVFRAAAIYLIRPVGCAAGRATLLTGGSWEVPFTCPPGVNMRALLAAQHASVIAGQPLHP